MQLGQDLQPAHRYQTIHMSKHGSITVHGNHHVARRIATRLRLMVLDKLFTTVLSRVFHTSTADSIISTDFAGRISRASIQPSRSTFWIQAIMLEIVASTCNSGLDNMRCVPGYRLDMEW